ncbi:MAG TPA: hypothetical protein VGI65_00600 [Steroidobacteraceae bacterium]
MRIASVGHAVFAATMIALGILGLIKGGFAPIWDSVPKALPGREALAYLCNFISLISGIGLLWRRTAPTAARVLFTYLFLWMLLFKVRNIVFSPLIEGSYQNWGETAVIVAGAWILYSWFASAWDRRWLGFAIGDAGVRGARLLYALAMIAFGLSHFVYLNLTTPLVPGWLGAPMFWAYFTGCAYLAAGVAMLIGVYARLAVALSALQMGLFLLLIWVPIVATGNTSDVQWGETLVNVALVAGAWVVADSYRAMPWFAMGKRTA